jgi:hypothetical protein
VTGSPDPIEIYLDQVADAAVTGGSRLRRLLTESEAHLRESADALVAGGMDARGAAEQAVARFGAPGLVSADLRTRPSAVVVELARATWLLGGIGLAAVGASGLFAWLLQGVAGASFLAGDGTGIAYTPARCADFLTYFPGAASCEAAAALHHADEIVTYRVALGAVGLSLLVAYAARRRITGRQDRSGWRLPPVATPAVAAVVFAGAAAVLLLGTVGLWVGEARHGVAPTGIGGMLSGGVVSLAAAAASVAVVGRRLRPGRDQA